MHGKIPVIHSRFYNLISKMSGSVVSALSILYEICPWMQTWFYTSAQNLLASHAVAFRGGGNTSPLKTTAWEAKNLLDQKDLLGSGEHFGY